jgi:hypothetical protein
MGDELTSVVVVDVVVDVDVETASGFDRVAE